MTDSDYVEATKKYFQRNFIDLHTACCLVAKVNPALKEEPVGKGYMQWDTQPEPEVYDYTRRPFLVALRALRGEIPEHPLHPAQPLPLEVKDARDIMMSTRTFVTWALKKWPDTTGYLQKAEDYYAKKKAKSSTGFLSTKKSPAEMKWAAIKAEFEKLLADCGAAAAKMSTRELADDLAKRLVGKQHAAKAETLRKRIAKWRG
ncbi:hypothetical protein KUW17_05675 [Leisingera aquaemixtae]|uniref:hypothetical protein n=1 Tax=Leisingera aquaemixtae TaxID=1396826 RepID=UPI001C97F061|nr:hypothetical protein [Leisingera aquaemixtae]MBY6066222.1 hypothetical protein [Leisingera aquaemixtae]